MRTYLILFFLFPFIGFAQETDSITGKYFLSAQMAGGFIIAHRPALVPLQEGHVKGFEISVAKKRNGEHQWEQDFLFPETGLSLSVFDLATDKLGLGIALYPYLDFPLTSKGHLHFRYGMGIGYIEKIFEKDENYKNAAIGSHWNGVIHFDLHYESPLNKKWMLQLGSGITHFSNGSLKMPNLGINIAHFNLGVKKSFGQAKLSRKPTGEKIDRSAYNAIFIAGGMKKVYPPYGVPYYIASITGQHFMPLARKSFWGMGADVIYDNSLSARLRDLKNENATSADNFRAGIHGAYLLQVGSLGLQFNMGFYLHNQWKDDGNFYHRIGMRYDLKKYFLLVNLKTHYARADYFETGIGYRF